MIWFCWLCGIVFVEDSLRTHVDRLELLLEYLLVCASHF